MASNPKVSKGRERSPDPTAVSDAEIDRMGKTAERRQDDMDRAGLVAHAVTYDRRAHRILIEMSSGVLFGIPTMAIPELRGMTAADIRRVELDVLGSTLRWDAEDIDVGILSLIFKQLGYTAVSRKAAALGGSAKTDAKAAAARANGKKGGRPRKSAKA